MLYMMEIIYVDDDVACCISVGRFFFWLNTGMIAKHELMYFIFDKIGALCLF